LEQVVLVAQVLLLVVAIVLHLDLQLLVVGQLGVLQELILVALLAVLEEQVIK
jgi:hypothetical protein